MSDGSTLNLMDKNNLINQVKSYKQQMSDLKAEMEEMKRNSVSIKDFKTHDLNASELHVAFMHASPIIFKDQVKMGRLGFQNVPLLDFVSEWRTIKQALMKTNQAITVLRKVARRDTFEDIISQQPQILHISCHGCEDVKVNACSIAEMEQ